MSNRYPAIADPRAELASVHDAVVSIKQNVELLTGARGARRDTPVTWGELVTLGVIAEDQIPK